MLYRCLAEGKMFVENPPDRSDWVSWLAEMQHYGASTRLLDVTQSKYIALFFALVGMKDEKPAQFGRLMLLTRIMCSMTC